MVFDIANGGNLAWAMWGFATTVYFTSVIWGRWGEQGFDRAAQLMTGVILVSLGSCVHRLYWFVGRIGFVEGDKTLFLLAAKYADVMYPFVIGGITLGYALHMMPLLRRFLGGWWWAWCGGVTILAFIIGGYA